MSKFTFFVLFFVLLFFVGCTEQNEAERMLCLNYSSFYSNTVPECSSPDNCLKKVNSEFKPRNEFLSSFVSWEYDKYLFHTSKSWYFFSLSKKNLKNIYDSCLKGEDYSVTAKNANELKNNLINLFSEIDSANKISLRVISLLEAELKEHDVNLVKETELFKIYSEINDNLNQVSYPKINFQSNSFYPVYLQRVKEFEEIIGFNDNVFIGKEKISFFEFIGKLYPSIKERIPFKEFFIPVLADSIMQQINSMVQKIILEDSVSVMQGINAQKSIQAIDGFVSSQSSSVASKFISLMNKTNDSFKTIELQSNEFFSETRKALDSAKKQLNLNEFDFSGFDESVLNELAWNSGKTIIVLNEFNSVNLTDFKEIQLNKINELELKLNKMKINDFSLGKKYSSLKKLMIKAKQIESEIIFFNNEEKESLYFLCEHKVSEIKQQIYSFNEKNELSALISGLKFNIALFEKNSKTKNIELCPKIVKNFIEFKEAKNNISLFQENVLNESIECRNYLKELILSEILKDFKFSVERLLLKENNYESLDECLSLKNSMEKAVYSSNKFIEFKKELNEFNEIVSGIKRIPLVNSSKLTEQLEFFNSVKKNLTEFLKKDFVEEIKKEKIIAENELKKELIKFIELNAEIESGINSVIKAGVETETITKISFFNPALKVNEIFFEFKLNPENINLISCNNCELIKEKNSIKIYFNELNQGNHVIQLNSKNVLVELNEEEKIILINEIKALIERKIILKSNQKINLLEIETELNEKNASEKTVLFKNQLIDFQEKENNKIVFTIINSENKDEIQVFYSVFQPIKTEFELIKLTEKTETIKEYEFQVKLSNMLSREINSIQLNPEIVLNGAIKSIMVLNESSINAKEVNQKIELNIKKFNSKEKKEFKLIIITDEEKIFWENKFNSLNQEMLLFTPKTNHLIQKLDELKQVFTTANTNINKFIKIEQEFNKIKQEQQKLIEKEIEYNSLRIKAEQMLSNEIEKLKNNGFSEENFIELKNLLIEADKAKENKNIDLALSLIKSFSAKLIDLPSKIEKNDFIEEANKIMNKAEKTINNVKLLGLNEQLINEKNELIELEKEMNLFLVQGKIGSAQETLNKMNEKEKKLTAKSEEEILIKFNEMNSKLMNKIKKLNELPEKINELKKLMNEFDKLKELIDYVPPTTLKRINSIEKELNEMPLKEMNLLIQEIDSSKNKSDKLMKLNEINSKYGNELNKIELFYDELNAALQKIIQDSVVYFNLAETQAKTEKELEAVEKAKQSIENKEFIKSIAFSKTAMLTAGSDLEIDLLNDFPIAIIPFIFIVIAVIAFKLKQKKEEKKPKKKRKIKGIK